MRLNKMANQSQKIVYKLVLTGGELYFIIARNINNVRNGNV